MSLTDRLAAYFRQRPNTWIDAHALVPIAGFAAWRTRLSELRKPPYAMVIENRTHRDRANQITRSEYRFVPAGQAELLQ